MYSSSSTSSSFVYHRIRSLTQSVGAMLWPMAQTSKRPDSDGGLCSGQLLIMWSAVCSVHTHMPHCPPVPTSSWMVSCMMIQSYFTAFRAKARVAAFRLMPAGGYPC